MSSTCRTRLAARCGRSSTGTGHCRFCSVPEGRLVPYRHHKDDCTASDTHFRAELCWQSAS
eukprot:26828-Eustigmatos_ZCMA.PRE.1